MDRVNSIFRTRLTLLYVTYKVQANYKNVNESSVGIPANSAGYTNRECIDKGLIHYPFIGDNRLAFDDYGACLGVGIVVRGGCFEISFFMVARRLFSTSILMRKSGRPVFPQQFLWQAPWQII